MKKTTKTQNKKVTKKSTKTAKTKKTVTHKKESTKPKKDSKTKLSNSSKIIISISAVVVIILLTALFIIKPTCLFDGTLSYSEKDYETYHGFNFEKRGDYWITFVELNGVPYEAPFNNHPLDLMDIFYEEEITGLILSVPHSKFIIAVSDHVGSTPVLAGANIARITGKLYGMPTSSALYASIEDRDIEQIMFPYVDCSDATKEIPIFWINVNSSKQEIRLDEENPNCIIVGGTNNEEILASADLLAYKILQIV